MVPLMSISSRIRVTCVRLAYIRTLLPWPPIDGGPARAAARRSRKQPPPRFVNRIRLRVGEAARLPIRAVLQYSKKTSRPNPRRARETLPTRRDHFGAVANRQLHIFPSCCRKAGGSGGGDLEG